RELAEVRAISHEVAEWLIGRGADCLVIACNTASAAALSSIRSAHPDLTVVGMEPAVKPAAAWTTSGRVAVFATEATFQGQLFDSVVTRFAEDVEVVTVACPEWVTMVEGGQVDGPVVADAIGRRVHPVVEAGVDTIVLGCTHFSFLRPVIERASGATVIDPSRAVAARVCHVAPSIEGVGTTTLAASGEVGVFSDLARGVGGIDANVIRFAA
ncbi:MAG: aspartate/glutamate racemase family protein, partial [Acidimicrobiia bacterium]